MELPSMVQRSGDTLIVRSVVSGNPIYMDQESAGNNNNNNNNSINNKNNNMNSPQTLAVTNNPNTLLMEHFQQLKRTQEHLMQQQQQNIAQEQQRQQAAAMELKEEGLPQCKIKRNYSCNYCTYFTQNPRYHLTHLRDVHGEKIVINKCKLCLYASRHYQKLVRHMKMVHGCTDGIASGHGQARGKRGMNREARKRKLEESTPVAGVISALSVEAINAEHFKADMEHQKMQRDIEAFKKQQEEQQKSQQQKFNEAIFAAAAYEQLRVQREIDNRESLKAAAAHSNYEQKQQQTSPVQNREDSPSQNRTYETATPAHQQHHSTPLQMTPQRSSLELTPSPSGSNSSPPPALALPPPGHQQHSDARSAGSITPLGASDEPSNNRLMKCSLCDFTTLYRNHLLEHEIEDHCNAKFYRCEKCSYVTHIKARFSKHVKYHSMPMIKCVTCDFRTPYKWNLDRHMKNHGGAGPFKCAACDFTADIKQSLTVHEMNHHVPPVGHAAGMTLARRRNKVGGTDLNEDFFSDSAEMLEDHFNNNNMDEYDEMLMTAGPIGMYETKRLRYDDDEPTDLSQKGGSSDTSSVHNSNLSIPKAKKPLPNLIPITKESENILNLSTDLASRSSLSEIASIFFNEKQISEMLQPADKTEAMAGAASQLSPTTTITSSASSRSLLNRKTGSFFDKIKSSSATNENLICPCGHMAKCLSESIIHRKTCTFSPLSANDDMDLDDDEHDEDGEEGRLEIDFTEDEECDKQSHSALNLSVTGSTRCQHCRHRCKSSVDLLNHLKTCSEANSRCDSLSGDSCAGSRVMLGDTSANELQHPMENRVFIWNKLPRNQQEGSGGGNGSQSSDGNQRQQPSSGISSSNAGGSLLSANNDENSYYGVETAPGYGEVTKKMTPEEEAANSSLKKVYKCPHCSFWASTASRFHVHIVGHLNKKPFECSLCSYRSNWRWDITKHIRLKTIRDPSHKNARVLMNDETGRRNYTKYNKYITLMKVTEEDGDPKLMKSGEMTPNQVASLAFINDYNNKQQNNTSAANSTVNNILNGVREDITLEPIPAKASVNSVDDQLSDNFIRLPLLASMVNAAMAQQQQQNDNEQNGPTLITPSVTISAVKKSPPVNQNYKPSDEITLEVRQEGNEKITNYKCRKCNFRHVNRDAVLAHVKVHFPDTNHGMISPKSLQQMSSNSNGPLQVAVNPNLYMNKVLAAMCLSQQQQQQQQQQQHNSNSNTQLTNLMAAGLLDQANNTHLSGLALALAGKSPLKTSHLNAAANIIEHGEQKASLNEASAQNTTTSPIQLTLKTSQNQLQQQTLATSTSSVTGVGSTVSTNSPSLQHLLTSPRGSFSQNLNDNLNNDTMVMGSTLLKNKSGLMTAMSPSPSSATPNTIVTTTTTPPTTPNHLAYQLNQTTPFSLHHGEGCGGGLLTGDILGGIQDHHHSMVMGVDGTSSSFDHIPTSTVNINNNNNMATSLSAAASSCSTSLLSLSNQNYIQTQTQNHNSSSSNNNNNNNLGNLSGNGVSNNNSNCNYINNNVNGNGNGNNNNNNNLLTHDTTAADRRDPSPYRCGHCHQVSNWKHVIQRHCRLKHAGVINIETLDRTATNDRHATPIYKPLVNGATNESNNNHNNNSNSNNTNSTNSHYNLTLKALQQQQNQNNNNNHNTVLINNNNNNNLQLKNANNVLKTETNNNNNLLPSPIATALNAANTTQDLQAAVVYLAAAYKAATNQTNNVNTLPNLPALAEELLLQQQLQQNYQIEITRVSSSNHNNSSSNNILTTPTTANNSNLAQLLESNLNSASNRVASPQHNAKSKQQKCPLCTYICDSKSQMNYHISLHKPTQYECRMCTFVCAKKQHLSSHMRTVHQMQQNQILAATSNPVQATNTNNINMDFGLALQIATAAQNQDSTNLTTPLAIDLSASPVARPTTTLTPNNQHHNHQSQLPPEYQYRMIYFCNKCPARYAQKHNDPLTAQKDLDEHLRQHENLNSSSSEDKRKYHCDYCDYRAMHESIIQTHRYVHTTQYQEKCNELYKNCKEDSVYRAPKLMHITATKKPHMHETIWVVDHDLNEGHHQQHHHQQQQQQAKHHQNSVITSSSQSNSYEAGNSLLKKQLESRQVVAGSGTATAAASANEDFHNNKPNQAEADDSNTASTSASVATGDLAHENESRPIPTPEDVNPEKTSSNNDNKEKCEHCPFESSNEEEFKTHLQQHICVSQQKLAYTCEHCDYSAEEQDQIEEHTRVHFNGNEKLKDVSFFTSYDNLEISMEQSNEENNEEENVNIKKEIPNNNNNEENRVNENLKDSSAETVKVNTEPKQPKCAKIILYKNDGCLTIKKETNEQSNNQNQQQQQTSNSIAENISDRLRRRISRQGAATANQEEQTTLTATSTANTSHKTILVNAKTGQIISRN
ncbi:putative uncharacterized protein DDB_G0282133 isoform X1 [Lucilia cuprina]|uniref:putative uncharacterized protein DDB_G0282133 isoform X1 n=1 Tax=Lucilia cuprina TaxID=7375 RepID=UPI001F06B6C8|nr:putative uncharacterized protein DDB_G0282133 isoform X1 [Lucilia cuprina]